MSGPIEKVSKGNTPTLIEANFANKLIDVVNALATMKVSPDGYGKVSYQGGAAVLDLGALQQVIQDLLKKINAIQTTSSAGADPALIKRVDAIISSINSSTLSIVCNGDGTITGTLTFPDMPKPSTG